MKAKRLFTAMMVMVLAGFLAGCATLPKDNAQLTEMKWDGLMGCRYTEILLVFGDSITKDFTAGVYNSTYLNSPPGMCDYSPAVILDKIDMKKVKEDNDALSTVKNGPRLWTVDHIGAKVGKDLGSRLKLPTGWKFRTLILEQDLVFMTDNGKTNITQDDIGNTYDRVGGPYSNFKP
jgi:hypothetical protein